MLPRCPWKKLSSSRTVIMLSLSSSLRHSNLSTELFWNELKRHFFAKSVTLCDFLFSNVSHINTSSAAVAPNTTTTATTTTMTMTMSTTSITSTTTTAANHKLSQLTGQRRQAAEHSVTARGYEETQWQHNVQLSYDTALRATQHTSLITPCTVHLSLLSSTELVLKKTSEITDANMTHPVVSSSKQTNRH